MPGSVLDRQLGRESVGVYTCGERERERKGERKRERERVCVYICEIARE